MSAILNQLRLSDLADFLLVAALLWVVIAWIRTSRARIAFVGLAFMGALYGVAQLFELRLTSWLLQGFFAAVVLMIIVVFQEDLRRLFERFAVLGLRRQATTLTPQTNDVVVRTVTRLARDRTGALIVIPGKDPLDRHLEGGIPLYGNVSEPILLSLFDASSPGHDGAALIVGGRIERFAVHLPLSHDRIQLGPGGTRHAAGLGLAERCDALCIVVSEERGTVSVAHNGVLTVLARPEELAGVLERMAARPTSGDSHRTLATAMRSVARRWRDALVAVALSIALWVALVPGSEPRQIAQSVAVQIDNLPADYKLESVDPPEVEVIFEGPLVELYLLDPARLRVQVDALLAELGRRTFDLSEAQIIHPPGLEVVAFSPDKVRISIATKKNRDGR